MSTVDIFMVTEIWGGSPDPRTTLVALQSPAGGPGCGRGVRPTETMKRV